MHQNPSLGLRQQTLDDIPGIWGTCPELTHKARMEAAQAWLPLAEYPPATLSARRVQWTAWARRLRSKTA